MLANDLQRSHYIQSLPSRYFKYIPPASSWKNVIRYLKTFYKVIDQSIVKVIRCWLDVQALKKDFIFFSKEKNKKKRYVNSKFKFAQSE